MCESHAASGPMANDVEIDPVEDAAVLTRVSDDMVRIAGGIFRMGSDRHYADEPPAHRVTVDAFWIDSVPVANHEFRKFVRATGYVTTAEIAPDPMDYPGALPHMLRAGSPVFNPPKHAVDTDNWDRWAAGALRHGVRWETLPRVRRNMAGRESGALLLRFVLRRSMTAIIAIHDGLRDSGTGRSPCFGTIVRFRTVAHTREERIEYLCEGVTATSRIIRLGLAMDVICQLLEYTVVYLVGALLLAFSPYLLIRGPGMRIARRWRGDASAGVIR